MKVSLHYSYGILLSLLHIYYIFHKGHQQVGLCINWPSSQQLNLTAAAKQGFGPTEEANVGKQSTMDLPTPVR